MVAIICPLLSDTMALQWPQSHPKIHHLLYLHSPSPWHSAHCPIYCTDNDLKVEKLCSGCFNDSQSWPCALLRRIWWVAKFYNKERPTLQKLPPIPVGLTCPHTVLALVSSRFYDHWVCEEFHIVLSVHQHFSSCFSFSIEIFHAKIEFKI